MPAMPTFRVEGLELPRFIVGTNSLLGYSHTSRGRDEWIRRTCTPERIAEMLVHCARRGADAVVSPLHPRLVEALAIARRLGTRVTWLSTTAYDIDTPFREQLAQIREAGSPICFLHGAWTDRWPLVDDSLPGLDEYTAAIREAGIIPATALHNADRLNLVTRLGLDFAAYLVPVNRLGFAMRPDREAMLAAVANCGRPVVAIKALACGRFDENRTAEWLGWALAKPGVAATAVGVMSEEEADEDVAAVRAFRASDIRD
jgi:hypothetical protein